LYKLVEPVTLNEPVTSADPVNGNGGEIFAIDWDKYAKLPSN
jgi:hypothetical protein